MIRVQRAIVIVSIVILLCIVIATINLHAAISNHSSTHFRAVDGREGAAGINIHVGKDGSLPILNEPHAALRANQNAIITKIVQLNDEGVDTKFIPKKNPLSPDFQMYNLDAPDCTKVIDWSEIDYTLVTQLSGDRMWMMEEHCNRWTGHMSILLFIDESSELFNSDDTVMYAQVMHKLRDDIKCAIDKTGSLIGKKNFSLQVVSSKGYPDDEYPVNKLRNMALSAVKTSHVVYLDVDFWPGNETYESLMNENARSWLSTDRFLALVIPAFQINRQCREYKDCKSENKKKMPHRFQDVKALWKGDHQQIFMFDPTNYGGHGSTLYEEWFKIGSGDLLDLPCYKSNRYEPYVAVRYCDDLPPYQEQFSGYGKNKVSQAMHMRRSGYKYSLIGQAWVVHYPHLDSNSRVAWNGYDNVENFRDTKRGHVDKLFLEFKRWLENELPDLATVHQCENFQNDDSKLWV